jgi:hypothetical protein
VSDASRIISHVTKKLKKSKGMIQKRRPKAKKKEKAHRGVPGVDCRIAGCKTLCIASQKKSISLRQVRSRIALDFYE